MIRTIPLMTVFEQMYSFASPLVNNCTNLPPSYIHQEQWSLDAGDDGPSVEPTGYIIADRVVMETAIEGWRDWKSLTETELLMAFHPPPKDREKRKQKKKESAVVR